jgi:excisionase family DNA binding protein
MSNRIKIISTEPKNSLPGLLTDIEVADTLGVSVATVRRWRLLKSGGPRYCRIGAGAIRYRREDIAAYVESRLSEAGDETHSG